MLQMEKKTDETEGAFGSGGAQTIKVNQCNMAVKKECVLYTDLLKYLSFVFQ